MIPLFHRLIFATWTGLAVGSITGILEVLIHMACLRGSVVDRTFLFHGLVFYGLLGATASLISALLRFALLRGRRKHGYYLTNVWPFHASFSSALMVVIILFGHLKEKVKVWVPILQPPWFLAVLVFGGAALMIALEHGLTRWTSHGRRSKDQRLKTVFFGFVLITALAALASYFPKPLPRPEGSLQPHKEADNIILIVVDCARADHLSLYGYPRETDPHIKKLAREGVVFSSAIAHGTWTKPSITSLLSGLSLSRHNVRSMSDRLAPDIELLPDFLHRAGYSTACISANSWVSPAFGLGRGVHYFSTQRNQKFMHLAVGKIFTSFCMWKPALATVCIAGFCLDQFLETGSTDRQGRSARALTEEAVQWISRVRGKPFFLYIHYNDLHFPYNPPAPFDHVFGREERGERHMPPMCNALVPLDRCKELSELETKSLIRFYDGELAYVDHWIGKLMNALKKMDLYERSMIIVTSDHGEEFYEHGGWGHGNSLFEETIRVPLVVRLPDARSSGQQLDVPVGHLDIAPTIADLVDIEMDGDSEGMSLVGLMAGPSDGREDRKVMSELDPLDGRYGVALRGRRYKMIVLWDRPERRVLFYDLLQDPGEERDLSEEVPDLVAEWEEALARRWGLAPPL